MKCLISGSTGFIGSNLVRTLEQLGHTVVPIYNEKLLSRDYLAGFMKEVKPDYIFHLAAYGNMATHLDMDKMYEANVIKTFNLLVVSQSFDSKAFINFSTSSVLLPNQTFYSRTKRASELLIEQFPNTVSARPSTVIGIGEQKEHLIPKLIRSCLYQEEMPFIGEPTHDFISVNDLIRALLKIVDNMGLSEKQMNISTGKILSNQQILEIVEKLTGKKANIKYVENLRSYDTPEWKVDNTDILNLGWKPQESIEQTIASMIKAELWN